MVIREQALYAECLAASGERRAPHPPFGSGYFVTEIGVLLRVEYPRIYRLETAGWTPAQQYFSLWYGGEDDFARIPPETVSRLGLDGRALLPWPEARP